MIELKIDPEFRDKIPPLTDEEFEQLKDNILCDGEVYEPICVWNGVIVDGHNRWKIVQEHPTIPFKIREMNFSDKFEAFDWMYKKQLGRRNLTDEQRTVLIGKMYEARKNMVVKRDDKGKFSPCSQIGDTDKPQRISDQIAQELGVAKNTVLRSEKFSKGLDKLKEVSPEAADRILSGKSSVNKSEVIELQKKTESEVKDFAESVVSGEAKEQRKRRLLDPVEKEKNKQIDEAINASIEAVRGEAKYEYTLSDVLDELTVIEKEFISKVRRVFEVRCDLIKGNDLARTTMNAWKYDIEKLKGEI